MFYVCVRTRQQRDVVELQLADPAPPGSTSYPQQRAAPPESSLEELDSRTLRHALKFRPSDQDEAFELAQVANHYDRRSPSGSVAPSRSAPDVRSGFDRGQSGTAAWQQSAGDPHNYTLAKAKALEAQRIAKQKKVEPYERGFWRKKPDYVEGTRMTVAEAKRAEAARHAASWSSAEVREWMKSKKLARLNPGPQVAAGALLGGISKDGLGSKFADKTRPSVRMSERALTNC